MSTKLSAPVLVGFSLLTTFLLIPEQATAQVWQPLFNRQDLTGWHTQPGGEWTVEDGVIVGKSEASERRHGLLVSDRDFSNFILRAKFRVHEGNSGLYFRAEETETAVAVRGFQAEVDTSPAVGGLYETAMRGWVIKPDPKIIEKIVSHGDWVSITVTAINNDLTVSLNGTTVSQLVNDEACLKKGRVALQLHGGQTMHVEFKDIAVLELP